MGTVHRVSWAAAGARGVLGLHMDELIHPDDMAGNRALVARLLDTGEPFTI
ncbi:hypothetical protein GM672_27365, partial [Massilia buxea]|nr:hypothetical protein [Pseudoduganella buxea]